MKNEENYVHGRENNPDSQNHLENKEQHFNKQCLQILALLKKGEVMTQKRGMVEFDIGDTRRRISELRLGGHTEIKDEWILDKDGKTTQCKKWFIPEFLKTTPHIVTEKKDKSTRKQKVIIPANQQPLF